MRSRTEPVSKWSGKLRVCRIFDETPGVKTFRLAGENDNIGADVEWQPGGTGGVTLLIPGVTLSGR